MGSGSSRRNLPPSRDKQRGFILCGRGPVRGWTPGGGEDNIPTAFSFTDQTGVLLSTVITSAPITIAGLGAGVSITLNATGGTIDKNADGVFLSSATVQNGDTVRARVTSSASNSTAVNCSVVAAPSGVGDTFSATTLAGAPTGFLVPAVPVGLETDTAVPTLPSPWNANTTNFYYVKQGGANGGNGYPASPRGTIPNPIPAGAIIVMDNTATLTGTNFTLVFNGTTGSRCWFISADKVGLGGGMAQIDYTGTTTIRGDYFFMDGVKFRANTTAQAGVSLGDGTDSIQNALIRGTHFCGNGAQRPANSSNNMQGPSDANPNTNCVLYQCQFYDMGAWDPVSLTADIDVLGLQINPWNRFMWLLECQFFHNQSDGCQFTGNPNSNTNDMARNIYFQDCVAYENLQTGFWAKFGTDVVYARCTVYNQNERAGADPNNTGNPIGMGGQYDIGRFWYLFNRIYDCDSGVRFAGPFNGSVSDIYMIGNIITNCEAGQNLQQNSANSWGTAISFWQGVNIYLIANTLIGFNGHGVSFTPNSLLNARLENNIIQGRVGGTFYDIFAESYTTPIKIKNNALPASPRFSLNGATTTSLATMQSGDATNRSNNLSGAVSFVNNAASGLGDYHVTGGDPTINAGDLISDVYATYLSVFGVDIKKDFAGTARPATGADFDIGAYETV